MAGTDSPPDRQERVAPPLPTAPPSDGDSVADATSLVPKAPAPIDGPPAPVFAPAARGHLTPARTWLLVVPSCVLLIGTIGFFIAAAMLGARLRTQQALLEEGNMRIRDLQLRVDELSKIVCVPD